MARPDGLYSVEDLIDVIEQDFKRESDLCNFIEKHIEEFCKDVLNVEYLDHVREYNLMPTVKKRSIKGNRRIDFHITAKSGEKIGVECKNPIYPCETASALGQCLTYISALECLGNRVDRMVLVSTKVDVWVPFVIKRFNLPVEFVVMDRQKILTLQ